MPPSSMLMHAWDELFRRIAKETDTEIDVARKKSGLVVGSFGVFVALAMSFTLVSGSVYTFTAIGFTALPSMLLLGSLLWAKGVSAHLWEAVTYCWSVALMLVAYLSAIIGYGMNPALVVIFLDLALINYLPTRVGILSISFMTICWSICLMFAATPNLLPDVVTPVHMCDCSDPPCRWDTHVAALTAIVDVSSIVLDFYLTRGFAWQVLEEKASMQAAIGTAEQVAVCLGGFDLDGVEELLRREESRLPQSLAQAFHGLLENLRVYKPYLPKSCLPVDEVALAESNLSDSDASRADSIESAPPPTPTSGVRADLAMKLCTTVTTNLHGLGALKQNTFKAFFAQALHMALSLVESHRGVVDVFVGDVIHSSFNASRMCVQHAAGAVRAMKELSAEEPGLNSGIATGRAHCGDLGCADMRRFSVVGKLPLLTTAIERAGRVFGMPILCNGTTASDARMASEMRLVPRLVGVDVAGITRPNAGCFDTLHFGDPIRVYELLVASRVGGKPQEWMYELQAQGDVWAQYDKAVDCYFNGTDTSAVLAEGRGAELEAYMVSLQTVASRQPLFVAI